MDDAIGIDRRIGVLTGRVKSDGSNPPSDFPDCGQEWRLTKPSAADPESRREADRRQATEVDQQASPPAGQAQA